MIALLAPDPRAPGLVAGYLYGRGVALAERGRYDEAKSAAAELERLAAAAPGETPAGLNSLRDVLKVAMPIVAARIAASEQRGARAIELLSEAVAAEDELPYNEASDWVLPAPHLLRAPLLLPERAAESPPRFRED